jgi:hypothetical protein
MDSPNRRPGIVYILTNEAMPGYIKVGRTINLADRVKELSRATGVPLPFEVFYAAEVDDVDFVERQLHEAFGRTRVAENREFFTETPERVVAAIKLRELRDVTPREEIVEFEEDKKALAKVKRYAKRYDFERHGIPMGSVLTFTRDRSVTCRVVEGSNVEFRGETLSLSRAAQRALGVTYQVAGPLFWEYEEETLDERRREAEKGGIGSSADR